MRAFACPRCGQLVFFENNSCVRCGAGLGFDPVSGQVTLVDGAGPRQRCANEERAGCNWLLAPDDPSPLCRSCRLTRTRPADHDLGAFLAFVATEAAKRRLVFQLLDLGLPVVSRGEDPERGLAFDLLSGRHDDVVITGHAAGVITVDITESDDAVRERVRHELGEPYRTMLGHLRHEIGHYYWSLLAGVPERLERFRRLFGDERAGYAAALEAHYRDGPPPRWADVHVSAYATAHPWEDWAETFAHYLHIRDTLQTAAAFGLEVRGPRAATANADALSAAPFDVRAVDSIDAVIAAWLPLTYALNEVNRSMGRDDLYPFVLAPAVVGKLGFVHEAILHAVRSGAAAVTP